MQQMKLRWMKLGAGEPLEEGDLNGRTAYHKYTGIDP